MAITPEQARKELARRELERREREKSGSIDGKMPEKQGKLERLNNSLPGVRRALEVGLEVANAPFEAVGEAGRTAVEFNNPGKDGFRAPAIFQRIGWADKTEQPPMSPFELANRLIRAGSGAVAGIPQGRTLELARMAYNADRGTMGTVEDTTAALLLGKLSPQTLAAPIDATTAALAKTASGAKALAKGAGKKAIRVGLGPTEEAISARYHRPGDLKAAKSEADLALDIERGHKIVENKIKNIETEVDDVLRTSSDIKEGATPKAAILKFVEDARKKIGMTVTNQEKYTKQILDDIYDNLNQMKTNISEKQLRDVVQKVRDAVTYGSREYGKTDLSLMSVAKKSDSLLKKNKAYAALMEREAPLMRLKEDVIDNFGLQRGSAGEGFRATDATAIKLKNVLKNEKEVKTQGVLERLKEETGQDYIANVRDRKLAAEFIPGERTRGSARTLSGMLAGGVAESFIPGLPGVPTAVGGAMGRAADYYGGSAAGKIIDLLAAGKTQTGNLLNLATPRAANATAFQEVIRNMLRGQPVFGPMIKESR